MLEQICQYDVDNKREEMKESQTKLRAIEKSIAEIDNEILALDFKILVCGSPIEYVPPTNPWSFWEVASVEVGNRKTTKTGE